MVITRPTHIILALACLALAAISALAGERTDFLVNDDAGITEQTWPRVAVAGDGSFVIAWVDKREANSDIYLQRFSTEGYPIGLNRKVNDDNADVYQAEPAVAVDLSGLYSVVWKDYRTGTYPFDPDVFFQRFDSSVAPVETNRNLTLSQPDSLKETPDISLSQWGGGVVVWADYRNRNWDIYGQMVSSVGTLVGANFRVNDDGGTAQQHSPRVSVSTDGWFVVTWYDNRFGNDDIFVQRFDSLGNKLGVNLRVTSESTDSRQAFPAIGADGTGHYTVAWVDWRNGTYPNNPDIYIRKYDTTMTAVTSEIKLNTDNGGRAQREPSIAMDRRGHVAVIWADSNLTSWDIVGQMIDVDGQLQDGNFQANADADSAQLHPDVALDGRYRYITWADKRNGNYDIYASIEQYSDPALIPAPAALKFEMERDGDLPSPQTILIEDIGFNRLDFEALATDDWFTVSPATGATPESLTVSIIDGTLEYGAHFSSIVLVNSESDDSSVTVSVRLDVTAPQLDLSADTLSFQAFALIDEPWTRTLTIGNSGTGSFSWTATESAEWLVLSQSSGNSDDTIELYATAASLTANNYIEPLVVTSGEAVGSPDTVWVVFEVIDNMPYLGLEPDSIYIRVDTLSTIDTFVVVTNLGVGPLNWTVEKDAAWLVLDRSSGIAGDTINLTIDSTGMVPGVYTATMEVTDSASFTISRTLPLVLDFFERSADSVVFGSVSVQTNEDVILPIELHLHNDLSSLHLPIKYDTSALFFDSIVFSDALPDLLQTAASSQPDEGQVLITATVEPPDTSLIADSYLLAEMHLTSRDLVTTSPVDTALSDTSAVHLTSTAGRRLTPVVMPGLITISPATDVGDSENDLSPLRFSLNQNYPNPFNLSTAIRYQLPQPGHVELVIFNVLGQTVRTLISEPQPAGEHEITWNGEAQNGRTVSSGIYFYRLRTGQASSVRKMALIK